MSEVIFINDGESIAIQCNSDDKMKDIIKKFLLKVGLDENDNIYFVYNGNKINNELTFFQQANALDKNRNKMNIIVGSNIENNNEEKKEMVSKDIICPECGENIFIGIKDFKINLYGCKKNHTNNDILLYKYENTQKINIAKIICEECNDKNKGNTHNNEFFICNTCNKNLCPLCKSIHNRDHNIINYDDKDYICKKHNEGFIKYCKKCNENICILCEAEHNTHDIINLGNMIANKDDLMKEVDNLKKVFDKFKNEIKIINEIFNKMIELMEIYYKINNDMVKNYNIKKRNYHKLKNLNNLKDSNEIIIKELNEIINHYDMNKIFQFSFDKFYNENGEKYIGEIKDNKKEGKGVRFYKNGRYEGDFKNNKRDGKGIFYFNSFNRYEGDYKDDKMEGKGIFYFKDGNRYEGDFCNDYGEGKGIKYYYNGDKYEGDWKKTNKEGKGIMYYNNGDRYEGEWKNNNREGKGIMYYNNGKIEEGIWKNDKRTKRSF